MCSDSKKIVKKSAPEFKDYFELSEDSASGLVWSKDRYSGKYSTIKIVSKGDVAGCCKKDNRYWCVKLHRKSYSVHRIIALLHGILTSYYEDVEIDHINGNPSDNRIDNLRKVSKEQNARNSKMSKSNKSGVNGVFYFTGKLQKYNGWRAVVHFKGNKITKFYSENKYGVSAFELACEWRESKIKELGIIYTERHGQKVVQSETSDKVVKILNVKLDEYLKEAEDKLSSEEKK